MMTPSALSFADPSNRYTVLPVCRRCRLLRFVLFVPQCSVTIARPRVHVLIHTRVKFLNTKSSQHIPPISTQPRNRIHNQLQLCLRAGFNHTLERIRMPSRTLNESVNLSFSLGRQNRMDVPDVGFVELGFELLADWRLDVEH